MPLAASDAPVPVAPGWEIGPNLEGPEHPVGLGL
jgi:hypothetical protein